MALEYMQNNNCWQWTNEQDDEKLQFDYLGKFTASISHNLTDRYGDISNIGKLDITDQRFKNIQTIKLNKTPTDNSVREPIPGLYILSITENGNEQFKWLAAMGFNQDSIESNIHRYRSEVHTSKASGSVKYVKENIKLFLIKQGILKAPVHVYICKRENVVATLPNPDINNLKRSVISDYLADASTWYYNDPSSDYPNNDNDNVEGGKNKQKDNSANQNRISAPRNLIYFGAPGTGKSYVLNENLTKLSEDNYSRVTFLF